MSHIWALIILATFIIVVVRAIYHWKQGRRWWAVTLVLCAIALGTIPVTYKVTITLPASQ